jgi:cyclic pyranopterin phosphate synthase
MADVSDKGETSREAVASCRLASSVVSRIMNGDLPKGDALETARIAGILAAKRVPELIPLCHPVRMNHIEVAFDRDGDAIVIRTTIRGVDRTGFEIEALTAASVAALTLYDMAKSEDAAMTIDDLKLESKSGGKSGEWKR